MTQLDIIGGTVTPHGAEAGLASPLEHATVVPAAEADGADAADDVGQEVEGIEGAAIGQQTLDDLGTNAQDERADDEGQVQGATAGGVGDPVEDQREQEEGDDVQELVIGLQLGGHAGVGAVRQETDVGGEDDEEDEGACRRWGRSVSLIEIQRSDLQMGIRAGRKCEDQETDIPAKG